MSIGRTTSCQPVWQNGWTNQFLIPKDQFSSLPDSHRLITGYRTRPDSSLSSPKTVSVDRLQILLSTTDKASSDLVPLFSQNVGSDETVVYDGPRTQSVFACSGSTPKTDVLSSGRSHIGRVGSTFSRPSPISSISPRRPCPLAARG